MIVGGKTKEQWGWTIAAFEYTSPLWTDHDHRLINRGLDNAEILRNGFLETNDEEFLTLSKRFLTAIRQRGMQFLNGDLKERYDGIVMKTGVNAAAV